ncbi:SDR family oxidoreductase [Chryseobacterium turcicum]|uniref:SDR family NAD(P)-dependent oxidoreductase n=1 Tax=Chryseobacterium turcicum TaxID=2898076 RepID=A0A9Q3YW47_9FLAO|nr:SDR family NAD(P)-dependent oxidoreductase [Chryseobacterium turcicum]MCD1117614.1 SDR family NAD(P)-dependent oxidoreductase [Chryseobacterium turcicum]
MNITNKTVLITGGGSGIGFAIAENLIAKGNKVIIVGRTESKLKAAAESLPGVAAIRCDVSNESDVQHLVNRVTTEFPELSVLINNAGLIADPKNVAATDFEKATEEFATNYFSVIRLIGKLLPQLKSQQETAIVNVSSLTAYSPHHFIATYSDSKAAIRSYTLSLRYTLAKDTAIKVFELLPPMVNTDLTKGYGGESGLAPSKVAQDLITAMENDEYEIQVGETAEFRKFYLSSPTEAFAMMNDSH